MATTTDNATAPEKKKTKPEPEILQEPARVEVFIPRGQANDDPNFFVGVNGKNYLLPRGKRSLVPREVAFEIERSFAAQEALDRRMQQMIDANK